MLALGIIGIGCELHIEGSARCDYPQVLVENDQRFTNGVHHCLRKGTSVFNFTELLFEHCRPLQSVREVRNSAVYCEGIAETERSIAATQLRSSAARAYLKVSNIDQRPAIRAALNSGKSAKSCRFGIPAIFAELVGTTLTLAAQRRSVREVPPLFQRNCKVSAKIARPQ